MKRLILIAGMLGLLACRVVADGPAPLGQYWKASSNGDTLYLKSGFHAFKIVLDSGTARFFDSTMVLRNGTIDSLNKVKTDTLYILTGGRVYLGGSYLGSIGAGLSVDGSGVLSTSLGTAIEGSEVTNGTLTNIDHDTTGIYHFIGKFIMASPYVADTASADSAAATLGYVKRHTTDSLVGQPFDTGAGVSTWNEGWYYVWDSTNGTTKLIAGTGGGSTVKVDTGAVVTALTPVFKADSITGDTAWLTGSGGAGTGVTDSTYWITSAGDTVGSSSARFNFTFSYIDSVRQLRANQLIADTLTSRYTGTTGNSLIIIPNALAGTAQLFLKSPDEINLVTGNSDAIRLFNLGAATWVFDGDSLIDTANGGTKRGYIKARTGNYDTVYFGTGKLFADTSVASEGEVKDSLAGYVLTTSQMWRQGADRNTWAYEGATANDTSIKITRTASTSTTVRFKNSATIAGDSGNITFSDTVGHQGFPIDSVGKIDVDRLVADSAIQLNSPDAQSKGITIRAPYSLSASGTLIAPVPATGSDGYVLAKTLTANGDSTYWVAQSGGSGDGHNIYVDTGTTTVLTDSVAFRGKNGIKFAYVDKGSGLIDTIYAQAYNLDTSMFTSSTYAATRAFVRDTVRGKYFADSVAMHYKGTKDTAIVVGASATMATIQKIAGSKTVLSTPSDTLVIGGTTSGVTVIDTSAIVLKNLFHVNNNAESVYVTKKYADGLSSSGSVDSLVVSLGPATRINNVGRAITIDNGTATDFTRTAGASSDSVNIDVKYDNSTVGVNGSNQLYVKAVGTSQITDGTITSADLNTALPDSMMNRYGDTVAANKAYGWNQAQMTNIDSLYADTIVGKTIQADTLKVKATAGNVLDMGGQNIINATLFDCATNDGFFVKLDTNDVLGLSQAQGINIGWNSYNPNTSTGPAIRFFYDRNAGSGATYVDSFNWEFLKDTLRGPGGTRKGFIKDIAAGYIDSIRPNTANGTVIIGDTGLTQIAQRFAVGTNTDTSKAVDSVKFAQFMAHITKDSLTSDRATKADSSNKALKDAAGNTIATTYAKTTDSLTAGLIKKGSANTNDVMTFNGSAWAPAANGSLTNPLITGDLEVTGSIKQWNIKHDFDTVPGVQVHADTNLRLRVVDSASYATTDSSFAIHPSVLYIPDGLWGWKYWLAFNPYQPIPLENPVVNVSNDGVNFYRFGVGSDSCPIPIRTAANYTGDDAVTYLSDPKLFPGKDGKLWMCTRGYSVYGDSVIAHLFFMYTTNGYTWTDTVNGTGGKTILADTCEAAMMSPSIILDTNGVYRLFALSRRVHGDNKKLQLRMWTAPNPGGPWTYIDTVTTPTSGPGRDWWHFDILPGGADLLTAIVLEGDSLEASGTSANQRLHLAYSNDDGRHWTMRGRPLLNGAGGTAWDSSLYKAAGYWVDKGGHRDLGLFYGGQFHTGASAVFKIGHTVIPLDRTYQVIPLTTVAGILEKKTDSVKLSFPFITANRDTSYLLQDTTWVQNSKADTFAVIGTIPCPFALESVFVWYSSSSATAATSSIDSIAFKSNDSTITADATDRASTALAKAAYAWSKNFVADDRVSLNFVTKIGTAGNWVRIKRISLWGYRR